ncbi:MAG: Bifunctional phosphoglucose/phosphomannose isomerase [Parcubacteria group bacterium GW2011_GWC1_39_29]|nr:MAG: Bifunctional phosphoglucose/phosphomannose isomerase [Parcubacteria group bacterium GW2011_GWC1_39_29]
MRDLILNFQNHIKEGYELGLKNKLAKEYADYIISGIGGSSVPGEILWMLTNEQDIGKWPKVYINRDFDLPGWIDTSDIAICISWSGATEETISSLNTAIAKNIPALVISKGGKLIEIAKQNNIPFVDLDDDSFPARFGVGYTLGALLGVLNINPNTITIDHEILEKEGRTIASKIDHKIPVIYTAYHWRKLANFWKTLFNENSKIPAFWNAFPLLNHNELESLGKSRDILYPIIIRSANDDSRQVKSINATIAILEKLGYNYSIVNISTSSSLLQQIMSNYVLGLWASFCLAELLNVDPIETPTINDFKQLKSNLI